MAGMISLFSDPAADSFKSTMAKLLAQRAMDNSTIQTPAQGMSNIAWAMLAGLEGRDEDKKDAEYMKGLRGVIGSAAGAPPGASMAKPPSASPVVQAMTPQAPSSPPAGMAAGALPGDLDMMTRIAMSEAGEEGAQGQAAVANVVKNRAAQSGMSVPQVITAKNQFEPMNTQAGRERFNSYDPQSPQYQAAAAAISPVMHGQAPDNTAGATHFYSPTAQAALGRNAPSWDNGTGQDIGRHRFFNLGYNGQGPNGIPQQPTEAAGGAPTQPPANPAQVAQAPQQPPQAPPSMRQTIDVPPHIQSQIDGLLAKGDRRSAQLALTLWQQYAKPAEPTSLLKDVAAENEVRKRQGLPPISPLDYETKKAEAGKPVTNINQQQESEFVKKAGELQANRFNKYVEGADSARTMIADINSLRDIGSRINTGKTAEVTAALGPYAEALGIKIDGLSEMQAYKAIVSRIQPTMRVAGSGSTSDYEMKQFLESLPSLGKTAEGNAMIANTLEALQQHKIAAGEIGSKVLNGEMTRSEGEKAIRALPDPFDLWKKNKGSSPVAATEQPRVRRYNPATDRLE